VDSDPQLKHRLLPIDSPGFTLGVPRSSLAFSKGLEECGETKRFCCAAAAAGLVDA